MDKPIYCRIGDVFTGIVVNLKPYKHNKTIIHVQLDINTNLRFSAIIDCSLSEALKKYKNQKVRMKFCGINNQKKIKWKVDLILFNL